MTDKKVWLITGAGRGLGFDIAKAALAAGDAVVATGRSPDRVSSSLGVHDDLLVVKLDVTDPASAKDAARAAVDRFGRIDVLVIRWRPERLDRRVDRWLWARHGSLPDRGMCPVVPGRPHSAARSRSPPTRSSEVPTSATRAFQVVRPIIGPLVQVVADPPAVAITSRPASTFLPVWVVPCHRAFLHRSDSVGIRPSRPLMFDSRPDGSPHERGCPLGPLPHGGAMVRRSIAVPGRRARGSRR